MAPVRKFRVSRWQQQGSKPRGPSQRKGICLCSCPRVSSTVLTDKEINTERKSNCAENRDRPSHWIQVCLNTRLGYVIVVWSLNCVQLFVTWTVASQAPLFVEFPIQEYWSGLPFPFPGDLPDPGIEPGLLPWGVCSLLLRYQGSPLLVERWVMYLLKLYPWNLSYLSWKEDGKRWNINRTLFQGMRRKSGAVLLPMILDVVGAQGRLPPSKSQGHIDYFELMLFKKQPMQERHSESPFCLFESRK